MITFLAVAHMVGATQHHVPCTCTHGRCYASNGMGWGGDDNVPCTCTHGRCYATSCSLHLHTENLCIYIYIVYIYIYVQSMASFFQRFNIDDNQITETAKNKHKRLDCQTLQFFLHVQIHCACQCIMTLPPKILWPTALLNTWTIITFPKSSFYHTNHTFLTSINV